MIKIQSSNNSSINTKINNNKIKYKKKSEMLINPNSQQVSFSKKSIEDKKINKLTETLNQLVSKVIKLKQEKEHYEKTIRRAINILRRNGAKTVSEINQENNSQVRAIENNDNKASSDEINSIENNTEVIKNTTGGNNNQVNSDENNDKDEIIDKLINKNSNNIKLDKKQEEKDSDNINNKDQNNNNSKQSVNYSAALITFNEKDMSNKDDKVEKLFVGKTLDELEDMLKKYQSESQANIDKLGDLIKDMKVKILELKEHKDKNKYASKNKNKGLDLLV